jgi:hypothetical protein
LSGWAGTVDKAITKHSQETAVADLRRTISERLSKHQNIHAGAAGDRPVQYLQKTHWALLDLLTAAEMRDNIAWDIIKMLDQRINDLEEQATRV